MASDFFLKINCKLGTEYLKTPWNTVYVSPCKSLREKDGPFLVKFITPRSVVRFHPLLPKENKSLAFLIKAIKKGPKWPLNGMFL
jgi:hypothetical protein